MNLRAVCFAAVLCLFSAGAVSAKSTPTQIGADPAGFAAQRAQIEKDFAEGEKYKEISSENRTQVVEALDRMEALMAGKRSIADLHEDDKVKLINDQELVNNLLTKASAASRMVCKREKRVGSHRTTSTCRTHAEWKRASEQSREDIERRRSLGDILPQEKPNATLGGN